jgi:hypothetical protein
MAKLTAAQRKAVPASKTGLPGNRTKSGGAVSGSYPMPDRSHAANAKARASQAVNAGRMSSSTEKKIDAKANRILGKGKSKSKGK